MVYAAKWSAGMLQDPGLKTGETLDGGRICQAFEWLADLRYEVAYAVAMNNANAFCGMLTFTQERGNGVPIDTWMIRMFALGAYATKILLVHNHPTQHDPKPSAQDETMTMEIAGELAAHDIELVDHMIFGRRDQYGGSIRFSFLTNDLIKTPFAEYREASKVRGAIARHILHVTDPRRLEQMLEAVRSIP